MTRGSSDVESSVLDLVEGTLRDLRSRDDSALIESVGQALASIDNADSRSVSPGGVRGVIA